MSPSTDSGPSITEAMGLLMQALQNEAEIFIKILALYSKGGDGWEEVRQVVERNYDAQQHAPRPNDSPQHHDGTADSPSGAQQETPPQPPGEESSSQGHNDDSGTPTP